MRGALAVGYGFLAYGAFWIAFLYLIGFTGNLFVSDSVDGVARAPLVESLLVDCGLFLLFVLPHSVLARSGIKRRWIRLVPPPIERSTYVLVASALLLLLFRQWRPVPTILWEVETPAGQRFLEILFWLGWVIAIHSSFLLDHWDFVGLRQAWLYARARRYEPVKFKMPDLYAHVRHPLMAGLLLAFWSTPVMTLGHLASAALGTLYILVGIRLEERDLIALYGEAYREYRRRVPMLIPMAKLKRRNRAFS